MKNAFFLLPLLALGLLAGCQKNGSKNRNYGPFASSEQQETTHQDGSEEFQN